MHSRPLRGVVGLAALLSAAVVVATPASADEPVATTKLPQGLSHTSPLRTVLAASETTVLARKYDGTWLVTSIADAADTAIEPVTSWGFAGSDPRNEPTLAGDTITSSDVPFYGSGISYRQVGGEEGFAQNPDQRYKSAAPGGWLNDDGTFVETAPGHAVHQLAVLPRGEGSLAVDLVLADTTHAVFSWVEGPVLAPTSRHLTVVDWESRAVCQYVAPASWCTEARSVPLNMTCKREYTDLTGTGVVWFDPSTRNIHRLSFATGATTTTRLATGTLDRLRATDTTTGWTWHDAAGNRSFTTLTGQATESRRVGNPGLATSDSRFWLALGAGTTAGLYSLTSAQATPALLTPDPVIPATAYYRAPAPTTGRVAWYDDQLAEYTFLDRRYGEGDALDAQRVIRASTAGGTPIVSGRRSKFGYVEKGVERGYLETLGSGTPPVPLAEYPWAFSGTRMLYQDNERVPHSWRVADLTTGWGRSFLAAWITLWGDHVVYATPGGDVYWQELSEPDVARVFLTHLELGAYTELWTAGDYAGWTGCGSFTDSGDCNRADAVVDIRTRLPAVTLPERSLLVALSDSYAVTTSGDALTATSLASGATESLVTGSRIASADANRVGWIAARFSEFGEPRLSVLPDTGTQARVLGTTGVPRAVSRPVQPSWDGEVDVSRPLVSCSVTVRSPLGRDVATVPCQRDVLQYGAAVFRWDLLGSDGRPVLDGLYTWTLNAADAHGPVLDARGEAEPVTGVLLVGPGVVTSRTVAPTRTDGAWVTSFDQDVQGVTAGTVRLRETTGLAVPVTLGCRTSTGAVTSCGGPVRQAVLRPVTPLLAGATYVVDVNPAGATRPVLAADGSAVRRSSTALRPRTVGALSFSQRWRALSRPGADGGTVLAERRSGARLLGTFTGTGLRLTWTGGPDRGLVDVRVDGTSVAVVDQYAARVTDRRSRVVTGLPSGSHRLELVVTGRHRSGATGSLVTVDTVTSSSGAPVGLLQRWSSTTTSITTATSGARASTAFVGSRFVVSGSAGSSATVLVDGVKVGTLTGSTYSRSGLSSGRHTVTVVASGPLTLLSLTA